jgi:membrane protein implicated in regulation of membrane protease activity
MEQLLSHLPAVIWFSLTGALIVGEVFTNTLYLLALSLGTLAAGALAYSGSPLEHQLGAAILLATVATLIIWLNRRPSLPVDMNDPDIGQAVKIISLDPLTVHYRGADWQAELVGLKPTKLTLDMTLHIQSKHANSLVIG